MDSVHSINCTYETTDNSYTVAHFSAVSTQAVSRHRSKPYGFLLAVPN